jgi:chromosome segregation ATPase
MNLRELIAYIRCNLDAEPEEIEYTFGSFTCLQCELNRNLTEELQDLRERIKECEDPINIIKDQIKALSRLILGIQGQNS